MDRDNADIEEQRGARVLRAWLASLAADADAAMGAAFAYASLPAATRAAWLDALAAEVAGSKLNPLPVFAPLLAVEDDAPLRARLETTLAGKPPRGEGASREPRRPSGAADAALRGLTLERGPGHSDRVLVLVFSLYRGFGEALACRVGGDGTIAWAKRAPLDSFDRLATARTAFGAALHAASVRDVTDELAHAVLATRRRGMPIDETMLAFSHAFAALG